MPKPALLPPDEAIAKYRKAIASNPKDVVAHNNLGVALARKGQFDEAMACYRDEAVVLREGDRIFVACEGGPSASRLETYPPRLEVPEHGGLYVLLDEGPRDGWRYVFVPAEA